MSVVTVWTKPICGQCIAVKAALTTAKVPFVERDLTAPDAANDLKYFRSIGLASAPITEYGDKAVPGFLPSEIREVIDLWRSDHPVEQT
ncbi:glutaredoxin family protein [Microbacterium sp. CFBP 8794]|uniref:glutaredoxin family protein n=1 Tax=Microbacterium sp. CFBP 8794 TaxID=2775269 RepID=UPI001785C7C2|nr:glutaredoxin family protein [Microbacterium sp. CFBP 8794]MBD8477592.1 glutaredoxin family protein [Microbacterium sp. CFBP 8794]